MSKQTLLEEQLNTITHAIGAFLGAIGLVFLLVKNSHKTIYSDVSILIYGLSVVVLFSASALYHWVEKADLKHKFRILDHISIYLLIAGTYTPVLLINLLESNILSRKSKIGYKIGKTKVFLKGTRAKVKR